MESNYYQSMDDEYLNPVKRTDPPRVVIDNESCKYATVIKMDSANKRGIPLKVFQVLTDLHLLVNKAYISSDGGWFMDVFNVTDHDGNKITDQSILDYIQKSLVTSGGSHASTEHSLSQGLTGTRMEIDPFHVSMNLAEQKRKPQALSSSGNQQRELLDSASKSMFPYEEAKQISPRKKAKVSLVESSNDPMQIEIAASHSQNRGRSLREFIVRKYDGCGLRELKSMTELTGFLLISRLKNVANADEAKEAALWEKRCIDKLWLRWESNGNENSQEILECLQPQFQLKELDIIGYDGLKFPSWISNPSYTHLSSINLFSCINCDTLPSIGKLSSLKKLDISDMDNIRNINHLLCRNDPGIDSAFPKLERLRIENMVNLEEWTGIEDGDFPCLTHIFICYCEKLSVLPSFSNLCSLNYLELYDCTQLPCLPEGILPASVESLIVSGCPKVIGRCVKDGEDWFKIVDVEKLYIEGRRS